MTLCLRVLWYLFAARAQSFFFGASSNFGITAPFNATVAAVGGAHLDFMLALGDLSYQSSKESAWCQVWKDNNVTDLFLLAGNYETGEDAGGNITQYISSCPLAFNNISGVYGIQYYFDYPAANPIARFIFVSPGVAGSFSSFNNYSLGGAGYVWLDGILQDARSRGMNWIVVNMHKNFISALTQTDEVGSDVMSLLFSYHVDVILQGHELGYMRSKQLRCAQVDSFNAGCVVGTGNSLTGGNSTVLLVIGMGGQALAPVNSSDTEASYFEVLGNASFGFGRFSVTPTVLHFDFIATSTFNDTFTITKPTSAPSLAPSSAPSQYPSSAPSQYPSSAPSSAPSPAPSQYPSLFPSPAPTLSPSRAPSPAPTLSPSSTPSSSPTYLPSQSPTRAPSPSSQQVVTNTTKTPTEEAEMEADAKTMIMVITILLVLLCICSVVIASQFCKGIQIRPRNLTKAIEMETSSGKGQN